MANFLYPTIADFKTQFTRDFPYGVDPNTTIQDGDINTAFIDANANFNPTLWPDQATFTRAYLLLAAHFLVTNIRMSSQGLNGQYNFLQQSKGVSSVSESFAIPEGITKYPALAMFCKTNYGAQYCFMLLPKMIGRMFIVRGTTQP